MGYEYLKFIFKYVDLEFSVWYMGDSPERNLCDVLVSFFNTIHFKLLKIGSAQWARM